MKINPVRSLNGVCLTERGHILDITGTSFVAGTLPIKVNCTQFLLDTKFTYEYIYFSKRNGKGKVGILRLSN